MNTITKPNSKMLALYSVTAVIMGIMFLITSANAKALSNEENLLSSRSSPVSYNDKSSKQAASRYAQDTNEAQWTAIKAIKQLDITSTQRKTREQVTAERKEKSADKNIASKSLSRKRTQPYNYIEFGIYDASSRLFEDFDYDGFYQTFSVRFDADVYGQYAGVRALVFADLYLSRDGGPWELYFTTDTFVIEDDSSEDEFEVISTLDLGYRTGHYDILVDLYEVGYSDIVATISSEDVEDLYALPLESSDRDEYIVVETYTPNVIISAGSSSISVLLLLACAIGWRLR